MGRLLAELRSGRSATGLLESLCLDSGAGAEGELIARSLAVPQRDATVEQRERLQVGAAEEVLYRKVQLICRGIVLSEAENWFVPSRLTEAMNRALEETETPFGRVIRDLQPYRRTLDAHVLWNSDSGGEIPQGVLFHSAIVFSAAHVPLSEVREVYQRQILSLS